MVKCFVIKLYHYSLQIQRYPPDKIRNMMRYADLLLKKKKPLYNSQYSHLINYIQLPIIVAYILRQVQQLG